VQMGCASSHPAAYLSADRLQMASGCRSANGQGVGFGGPRSDRVLVQESSAIRMLSTACLPCHSTLLTDWHRRPRIGGVPYSMPLLRLEPTRATRLEVAYG